MAYSTNCPECGKTNVKGLLTHSSVPGLTMAGGLAGFTLGPLGPLLGATAGACVGKLINKIRSNKEYRFECPRCGHVWCEVD